MAHFLKPPTATPTVKLTAGYDVDNRLAPGSVWRIQVLVGGSRKVALWGGAGLRIRSNNDDVVPNSELSEESIPQLRLIKIPGKTLGTSMLEVGQGGDDKKNGLIQAIWIWLQVQVTEVTKEMLLAIMPGAGAAAAAYVEPLNRAMVVGGINRPEQRAAFLAQLSVESGQLRKTVEDLYNYSADRLMKVWPRLFRTVAAAEPYVHNPEALGNHVYAGRLGNGNEASGDGWRFRGRGLIQVTGRVNYRDIGYENNPEALEIPAIAASSAAAFWQRNGLNGRTTAVLNQTLFDGVSKTVNFYDVNLRNRWEAYQRALPALGLVP
jgi:predicted chitinase